MNNKLSPFYKTHQPCPDCNSSDALCINEDRSTKCFSCGKFTPKPKNIVPMNNNYTKPPTPPTETVHSGTYAPLTDRSILKETAMKYGVKVVYDSQGVLAQHRYPYHINNEQTGTKIRYVKDKNFKFEGTMTGAGLLVNNFLKKVVNT